MKLGYYFGMVSEIKTGTAVHFTNLIQNMLALRPEDQYISFLPSVRRAKEHKASLTKVDPSGHIRSQTVPIPPIIFNFLQSNFHVPPMRLLLNQPYDIFHQMWVSTDPAVPSHKLVVTMHDTVALKWPEDEGVLFKQAGRLLRRAQAVITVSEFSRNDIIETFDVKPDRVHKIYNGCDHTMYNTTCNSNQIDQTLNQLGISLPYLLYVGGQTPRKNLPGLIKAFALVQRKNSFPHQLILAGPFNHLRPEIDEAIAVSGCSEDIRVLGYVPNESLPVLYQGAAALIFPSLYEGFGLPVIEAMACGTPVVTSNTTSLPEVAGDAAKLVDPKSIEDIARGILQIIEESDTARAERVKKGIMQSEKFSWKRCAEEHLAVYDAVMAKVNSKS